MDKSSEYLFPAGFHTKTPYASLFSPTRATCPVHIILLDYVTRTIFGGEKRSGGFTLCNCLYPRVTSSLLGQNTFINTLFSNHTACVLSAPLRDRFSHPREKCGQITLPCMLILILLHRKQEDKRF
jgi:hypothetical protein